MTDTTQIVATRRCPHCNRAVAARIAFCSHCGARMDVSPIDTDALLVRVRALFSRELEIEREIGRGGMAAVYAAFDRELHRRVAVKVLLPDEARQPETAERFRREARLVASLQHPNVVSVYSVRSDDEMSAIVMQFVDGRSLDIALTERSTLAPAVSGTILSQVAAALEHAHARDIVHRDIKPANVLLDRDGHAVVSDFGIATRQGGTRITGTGVVMGTVAYMSPEQCLGQAVTPAADQYSFGIMAFELLAGFRPFERPSVGDMLHAHVNDPPPDLRTIRPNLPVAVTGYVMRMLAKNPSARHANLSEAAEIFRRLVGSEGKTTTSVVAAMAAGPTVRLDAAATVVADREPDPSRRKWLLAAGVIGILAVGASVIRGTIRSPAPAGAVASQVSAPTAADKSIPAPSPAISRVPAAPVANAAQTRVERTPTATLTNTGIKADTSVVQRAQAVAHDSVDATPPRASAPREAPLPAPVVDAGPPAVIATLADARAVAREFVTWCNQRRARDVEALASIGGDAAARDELIRLVRSAPDLAVGFDRVASSPELKGDRFVTEFAIELEWRGGRRVLSVTLQATRRDGAWHPIAMSVVPSG